MPNLIETYARSAGLKIDKPWIKEDFWPLPHTRFITLSAGSGQAAKNYSHWQIVIDLLNPLIAPLGIHIVQLGDSNTPLFSGTYDLRGKMSIAQSTYLVKRAAAHLGNDSWSAHVAGFVGTPLVALYGTTDKVLHGPHWQDKTKTILLESHRWGRKPTFGAEQSPKSIDTIPPEDVANAALSLLGIAARVNQRTQFIGPFYPHTIFDWVPNAAPSINLGLDVPITVRMDLEFNEANLLTLLQTGRKVTIVTNRPLNLQMLAAFRQTILSYSHELTVECPIDYVLNVKRLLTNVGFFTRGSDVTALSALRFHFFDVCSIEHVPHATRDDFLRERAAYLNKPLDKEAHLDILYVKTNKFIMSNGKTYITYAHVAADKPVAGVDVRTTDLIDNELTWHDLNHYLIYENTN